MNSLVEYGILMLRSKSVRTFTFFTISFLCHFVCFAQKQTNIWYFGDSAGLDFNYGAVVALLDGKISFPYPYKYNEGSAVISDEFGSLLFYLNGMTVWDKKHDIMQNGNDLLGNFSSNIREVCQFNP